MSDETFRRIAASVVVALAVVGVGGRAMGQSAGPDGDAGTPVTMTGDGEMDMGAMQGGSPPPDARDPHEYSDGVDFTMGAARTVLADHHNFGSVLVETLELARADGSTFVPYDLEAWFGRSYERAVFKAEGKIEGGDLHEARTEILWGHPFAPYWDMQLGIRHDSGEGPGRTWLAAGFEGLAPYWFELELTAYLGESGRSALRFDASYEMLLTQRWILEPSLEANFFGKADPRRGLGSGLSDTSLALRLRYEVRRELAPYVGLERVDAYGETETLARAAGTDASDTRFVAGVRFWF